MDAANLIPSVLRNMYAYAFSPLWMTSTPVIGDSVHESDTFPNHVVFTLKDFIKKLNYTPEYLVPQDNTTLQTLRQELQAYNNGAWFDATCLIAANLAEVCSFNDL